MFLLSIGHYPEAPGATNGQYNEHDIATRWAERIETILLSSNFPIEIVPVGGLGDKVDFINNHPDVEFTAELHFNSNINANGSECLHYPGSEGGQRFSDIILDEFEKREIFQPNRGSKEGYYYKNGKKTGDILYFLENTKVSSALIEPQFIYHAKDIEKHFYEGCDSIAQAATRMKKWMDSLNG